MEISKTRTIDSLANREEGKKDLLLIPNPYIPVYLAV